MSDLGLAEVITALREELYTSMVDSAGKLIKFQVESVDLELKVEVSRDVGANGKVRFWVIELGADGARTTASTQTINLKLKPVDAVTSGPVAVSRGDVSTGPDQPQPRSRPASGPAPA